MTQEKWVSLPEFAATYGVAQATIQLWIRKGQVRAVKVGDRYRVLDTGVYAEINPRSRILRDKDKMPLLETGEVAGILGVTAREVWRLAATKRIPCTRIGKFRGFSVNDVRAAILYREQSRRRRAGDTSPVTKKQAVIAWVESRLKKDLEVDSMNL